MASGNPAKGTKTSKKKHDKLAKILTNTGIGLLVLGILLLFVTLYPVFKEETRYEISRIIPDVFEEELVPPNTDFSILVPKIRATASIIKNVNPYDSKAYQSALTKGVAHATGTAFPGQNKNIFLFSHSSVNFYEAAQFNSVFYLLHKMEKGDEIQVYYQGNLYNYTVSSKSIVNSESVAYLENSGNSEKLTLMTCWPPGTTFKRLIIQAEPVPNVSL